MHVCIHAKRACKQFACTKTYTHLHIQKRIQTHIYIHTYIHTYRYTYIQIYKQTYVYVHTYTRTRIHMYAHANIHKYTRTYTPTYLRTCIRTNTYKQTIKKNEKKIYMQTHHTCKTQAKCTKLHMFKCRQRNLAQFFVDIALGEGECILQAEILKSHFATHFTV